MQHVRSLHVQSQPASEVYSEMRVWNDNGLDLSYHLWVVRLLLWIE
jgi:hypothetical protein